MAVRVSSGKSTGSGGAVAVPSRSISGGGAALSAVVNSSRARLVFALCGAGLGLGAAVGVVRGGGRGRRRV